MITDVQLLVIFSTPFFPIVSWESVVFTTKVHQFGQQPEPLSCSIFWWDNIGENSLVVNCPSPADSKTGLFSRKSNPTDKTCSFLISLIAPWFFPLLSPILQTGKQVSHGSLVKKKNHKLIQLPVNEELSRLTWESGINNRCIVLHMLLLQCAVLHQI